MATIIVRGKYTQQYAITITVNPKFYSLTLEEQYDLLQEELNDICNVNEIHLDLIVELTQSFNIHGHGYISIPRKQSTESPPKRIHDFFRKSKIIGHIMVKPIDHYNGWYDYCVKEFRTTKQNMMRDPVIHNHEGMLKRKFMFECEVARHHEAPNHEQEERAEQGGKNQLEE